MDSKVVQILAQVCEQFEIASVIARHATRCRRARASRRRLAAPRGIPNAPPLAAAASATGNRTSAFNYPRATLKGDPPPRHTDHCCPPKLTE